MWIVVSTIECHTKVLQGLSHHDFFLATVRNFDSIRPDYIFAIIFSGPSHQLFYPNNTGVFYFFPTPLLVFQKE